MKLGRPRKNTPGELVTRLQALAPASYFPTLSTPLTPSPSIETLCSICTMVLDRPIELGCGNMVCLLCCTRWLTISDGVDCPCCYCPILDHTQSPSRVTMAVLGSQLVECDRGCNRTVRSEQYQQHLSSQCQAFFEHSTLSPSRTSIQDVLDRKESQTTPAERKVAANLIKRLMAESDGQILRVPSRGQVYCGQVL